MMITRAYLGISLDGFIAGPNGELDWLDQFHSVDYGYNDFIATVDTIVLGRRTYEAVAAFPEWGYGERRVIVLSSNPEPLRMTRYADRITVRAGAMTDVLASLEREGAQQVYVDGGDTVRRCMEAGRLQSLTLTILPIMLGTGTPLFTSGTKPSVTPTLTSCRSFENGAVQLTYTFPTNP